MSEINKELRKDFIIEQYRNNERVLSKGKIENLYNNEKNNCGVILIEFKSSNFLCGDEIKFLVWRQNNKIRKIRFSNEDSCLITGSAANIFSSMIENDLSNNEIKHFIENVKKMLKGASYDKEKVKDFIVFSEMSNFESRRSCIEIVIDFADWIVNNNEQH